MKTHIGLVCVNNRTSATYAGGYFPLITENLDRVLGKDAWRNLLRADTWQGFTVYYFLYDDHSNMSEGGHSKLSAIRIDGTKPSVMVINIENIENQTDAQFNSTIAASTKAIYGEDSQPLREMVTLQLTRNFIIQRNQ